MQKHACQIKAEEERAKAKEEWKTARAATLQRHREEVAELNSQIKAAIKLDEDAMAEEEWKTARAATLQRHIEEVAELISQIEAAIKLNEDAMEELFSLTV